MSQVCDECVPYDEFHLLRVQEFASAAFRYCQAVGGSVTSWVRTSKRNASVGGAAGSKHLQGLALDVVPDPGESFLLEPNERAAVAYGLGLKLVVEANHDHLQAR